MVTAVHTCNPRLGWAAGTGKFLELRVRQTDSNRELIIQWETLLKDQGTEQLNTPKVDLWFFSGVHTYMQLHTHVTHTHATLP